MNIGKRIEQRLQELGWERNDLLARVPDLSPQSLSNLIRRDSKRSEWDTKIAEALDVDVVWLVYGELPSRVESPKAHYDVSKLTPDENLLLRAFRGASNDARQLLLQMARQLDKISSDFITRTGTH